MMLRRLIAVGLMLLVVGAIAQKQAEQPRNRVLFIHFKDVVSRATADYVIRAVGEATERKAACLIVLLDTPGGELESTRAIVQAFLSSPVPIVVYVYPAGARAGSAGVFITMAANIAAMAPGTNIGAAHPVGGQGEDIPGDLRKKIENDTVAFIQTIAKQRNRNAEWGKKAVLESVSIPDYEAVQKGVVDLVATDMQSLLNRIDGRKVMVAGDTKVVLRTKNAVPEEIKRNWREWLLSIIAHPNVFYILMLLALYGLIGELQNPGATLPGVVGVIALLLALYAASVLTINVLGVVMILLAFALFLIDLFAPTHGVLTAGALVSFVIGSVVLFQSDSPVMRVSWWLIGTMTLLTAGFFVVMTFSALRAQFNRKVSGAEGLIGRLAEVRVELNPVGQVFVDGALWRAISMNEPVPAGEQVVIERVEGLTLHVRHVPQITYQPKEELSSGTPLSQLPPGT